MADEALDTDYLVIGTGAAGMAFTDALLTHSDATVTLVDRRHAPGGHWLDAYPFVRLHQPSSFYGVSSVPLGADRIDTQGTNAGYYELAGADELRAYYAHVMQRHFLPSGRVRYFPNCEHLGQGRFASRVGPQHWQAKVRRKLVDTTYAEGRVPATSPPPFEVEAGVRCLPAGEVVHVRERAERFVIVGAGKTALDTCVWLLEQGVPASAIRWIRPREAWWVNRRFHQPHSLLPDFYRGMAMQLEAMALADTADEMFARLEAAGFFLRIDPQTPATMFRGALVSEAELALLRQVQDVVRLGHVRRIGRHEIVLELGRVPTSEDTLHLHCAAQGLGSPPLRPIFEPGLVTMQPVFWGFACLQSATVAMVEATVEGDDEKNRLCPPIANWNTNRDYLCAFLASLVGNRARGAHPALAAWSRQTRLNPLADVDHQHRDNPVVQQARDTIKRHGATAAGKLAQWLKA